MLRFLSVLAVVMSLAMPALAEIRVIAFGAHPDDCDIRAGGLAAKYAAAGHAVKFVSVTNGDVGHHEISGGELARRRRAEAMESGRLATFEEVRRTWDPDLRIRSALSERLLGD